MVNLDYGAKKSQFRTIIVCIFAMPIIAFGTFTGIMPLDNTIGWLAIIVFIVGVIMYFTKFRGKGKYKNVKHGMKEGDERPVK